MSFTQLPKSGWFKPDAGELLWGSLGMNVNSDLHEATVVTGDILAQAYGGSGVADWANFAPTGAFGCAPASGSNATITLAGGGILSVTGGAFRPAQVVEAADAGYAFASGTTDAFYRIGTNIVGIKTGGTEALRVTSAQRVQLAKGFTGDVGVGVVTPTVQLDVHENEPSDNLANFRRQTAITDGFGYAAIRAWSSSYTGTNVDVPSFIRAGVAGFGHFSSHATTTNLTPGIFGYVPTGGHSSGAIPGMFMRGDSNVATILGGAHDRALSPYAIETYDNDTPTTPLFCVTEAGRVGINKIPSSTQLDIVADAANIGLRVDSSSGTTLQTQRWSHNGEQRAYFLLKADTSEMTMSSVDLGNDIAGPHLTIGRNTNGTVASGGYIALVGKAGTLYYLHVSTDGKLRVGTTIPIGSNDTVNTIVGTQS